MIRVTVQGTVYDFDQEHLLLAEAREMKTLTKLTPPKWSIGIDEADPDAVAMLIYLAKKRAGETLRFSDLDGLDYADIELELLDDADEEAAGEGQEEQAPAAPVDPTPPTVGTTPTDGTSDISPPSPTTSSTPPPTSAP